MFICMYECIRDGFVNVAASDDQWKLKHYWVLPTGLQNRPQWQAAGVGGCGSHPLHWWGKNSPPHPEKMLLKACDWLIVGLCVCVFVLNFQKCLLAAMDPCNQRLTKEEKARNGHTECAVYTHDSEADFTYPSSLPPTFPDIIHCHVRYKQSLNHSCMCFLDCRIKINVNIYRLINV